MRSEDVSMSGKNLDIDALHSIKNKLSDERNLRHLHLKHNHVYRTVQEENNSLGLSWKNLRPPAACGGYMPILQVDETES